MGAGADAGGAADLIEAEVALGGLQEGFLILGDEGLAVLVAGLDHADGAVGTVVGAGGAADTGIGIDHDLAAEAVAVDGTGRAANHADGVGAVHAGLSDHEVVVDGAVAEEAGVAAMGGGAGADAVVATRATVKVDDHGLGAVKKPVLGEKLHQGGVRRRGGGPGFRGQGPHAGGRGLARNYDGRRELIGGQVRQHVALDHGGGDREDVGMADDAEAVLQGDRGVGVFPVVGDLVETVDAAGAEVVQGAVTGAMALGEAGEAGAHHHDAVRVVALGGDGGFLGDGGGAGLDEFLVFTGPVVVAEGLELGGGLNGCAGVGGEVAEEGNFLEVRGEGALAVDLVHVGAQGGIVFQEVAQALPADFQQLGVVLFGEDGRGARHARKGGDLAEEISGVHTRGLVFSEDAGDVLKEHGAAGLSLAAPMGDDLVFAGVGPELSQRAEQALFAGLLAADRGGREAGRKHDSGAALQDEERGGAVVAFAHDEFVGLEGADGGVVAQDVGQGGGAGKTFRIHRTERGEGEQAVYGLGWEIGVEGGVPAAGAVEAGDGGHTWSCERGVGRGARRGDRKADEGLGVEDEGALGFTDAGKARAGFDIGTVFAQIFHLA